MVSKVGNSDRTLGKHNLLNSLLGKETGIMGSKNRPHYIYPQYTFMDLCAGDGMPSVHSGKASPSIMAKHHAVLRNTGRVKTNLVLVERNANTFNKLESKNFDALLLNMDAREITVPPVPVKSNSAMFIHADPNHVEDWPVSSDLLHNCPEYTTLLATLGCNVGGLKRLPREERDRWFGWVDALLGWMPKRHDALLVVLRGDAAQWAYLIVGPVKWHDKGEYKMLVSRAFKHWKQGIDMVRYKPDPDEFFRMRDKLFLTKEELQPCQTTLPL